MRIRTIKPEFFLHEGLSELEPIERIAFIGLWCAADREGRFEWRPLRLKVQILPYEETDFSRVLDALMTRGFIVRYASQGVDYGWIPSFTSHQHINHREKDSELPEPTEEAINQALTTREPRVDDASATRQGNARAEGKGREGKGTSIHGDNADASPPCSEQEDFSLKPEEPKPQNQKAILKKLVELYREFFPSGPDVLKATPARVQIANARWREYNEDTQTFIEVFQQCEASFFLSGRARPSNGREKPFKADFDWIMKQQNFLKIYEGKYDG